LTHAFVTSKNAKVVSLNLAHPVYTEKNHVSGLDVILYDKQKNYRYPINVNFLWLSALSDCQW